MRVFLESKFLHFRYLHVIMVEYCLFAVTGNQRAPAFFCFAGTPAGALSAPHRTLSSKNCGDLSFLVCIVIFSSNLYCTKCIREGKLFSVVQNSLHLLCSKIFCHLFCR